MDFPIFVSSIDAFAGFPKQTPADIPFGLPGSRSCWAEAWNSWRAVACGHWKGLEVEEVVVVGIRAQKARRNMTSTSTSRNHNKNHHF